MRMSTIDVAGLEGGRVNLASKQLDDLDSRLAVGCYAPAMRAGMMPS